MTRPHPQSQTTLTEEGIERPSRLDEFAPDADDDPEGGGNNE
jgi:hypothetical protein